MLVVIVKLTMQSANHYLKINNEIENTCSAIWAVAGVQIELSANSKLRAFVHRRIETKQMNEVRKSDRTDKKQYKRIRGGNKETREWKLSDSRNDKNLISRR